jgi:hypothetical protein
MTVDLATGELSTLDEANARRLTLRIKALIGSVSDQMDKLSELITEAQQGGAHLALGYRSWTEYVAAEFTANPLRLDRDDRRQLVAKLSDAGMSTRAIAPVVGVSHMAVANDREALVKTFTGDDQRDDDIVDAEIVEESEPVRITGRDGKSYPTPAPRPRQEQRQDAEVYLNLSEADARKAALTAVKLTPGQIERVKPKAALWVDGLRESVETLQRLLTSLTTEK